jgi:hypothetical protein
LRKSSMKASLTCGRWRILRLPIRNDRRAISFYAGNNQRLNCQPILTESSRKADSIRIKRKHHCIILVSS